MRSRCVALDRDFYRRDVLVVAPELLNKVLVVDGRAARIVEVEAYRGADDPGSHGHRGRTRRNATMFGPPGRLYVYFTYGMHWCANVVCGEVGDCMAVLVRACRPLAGLTAMRAARSAARRDIDLCNGPAKLCQALGITGGDDGADLVLPGRIGLYDDGTAPPDRPARDRRIGLAEHRGAALPWRWYVPDEPHVSRTARPAGRQKAMVGW